MLFRARTGTEPASARGAAAASDRKRKERTFMAAENAITRGPALPVPSRLWCDSLPMIEVS
jgi:hypothetical protein